MRARQLIFRVHAIKRMFQRSITIEQVRAVLEQGEVIEDYPDDTPYPSRLLLGWIDQRPLHVVAAYNAEQQQVIIITAYEPEAERWDREFKRRKT
ncbi:MAG: DUF4258 domain-containing protein [Anaerolineae bacterium]|nr:DUF4258 domain-containing protein [Anaerolineae bacterium]